VVLVGLVVGQDQAQPLANDVIEFLVDRSHRKSRSQF
jgi:hypothetical protein